MRLLTAIALATLVACAKPSKPKPVVEPPAPWKSADGKRKVKIELAWTLIDMGRTRDAMNFVRAMRSEGGDEGELDLLQGTALYKEGAYQEARRILDRAAANKKLKKDPRPHRTLGLLHADDKNLDASIASFRRAIELVEADASTWNNLGFVLTAKGDFDEARSALQRAIDLDGNELLYRNNLGFALAALGEDAGAVQIWKSTGSDADAWYNLGVAYETRGDLTVARQNYEKALEIEPRHIAAVDGLKALLDASADEEPNEEKSE